MSEDLLDRLAAYRPTTSTIDADWPPAERARARARLLTTRPDRSLRFRPAERRMPRALAPVAASAAVLALIGAVLVTALGDSGGRGAAPAAGPTHVTATDVPVDGQYAYRYDHQIDLDVSGRPMAAGPDELRNRSWVAPNGDVVSSREGSQSGCEVFPRAGSPDMSAPSRDFLAGLPTDVGQLAGYLRGHVAGSTSRDEAVFVAIGDALRTGDLLATSQLRGALFGVLGTTSGVTIHPDQQDYLGRPAIRADFVDERNRPGEVQSMYFDPNTYQLLEERDAASSQSIPAGQPSPGYDEPPSGAGTPAQLTGAAYLNVMVEERVVDSIPFDPAHCTGVEIGGAPLGGSGAGAPVPTKHPAGN